MLRHAEAILADGAAGAGELRYLRRCLTASLADAVHITEWAGMPVEGWNRNRTD
jgi:hypothetical protein